MSVSNYRSGKSRKFILQFSNGLAVSLNVPLEHHGLFKSAREFMFGYLSLLSLKGLKIEAV